MSRPDDDLPNGGPEPAIDLAAFPVLEAFALAYLHEDYEIEYGSPETALRAFTEEGGPEELVKLVQEWHTLRERVSNLDDAERLDAFAALGAAWQPDSWREVERLFSTVCRVDD